MDWLDPGQLQAAAACLVACAVLGWFVPTMIERIPEPQSEVGPEPEPEALDESDPAVPDRADPERRLFERSLPERTKPKELYADIAAARGLAWWTAAWSGLFGAAFGATLGWSGALVFLVPLVPIGVALMVIDWRTTLLPNRIIFPTYALLVVLIPVATLIDGDLHSLYRAGWGWLIIGGWFWVFWFLFNAWGYGDVRLAGVLGLSLGYLGWYELLMGLALILLVGGLGGLVIGIVTRDLRRRVPYGPFMLIGSALSVVIGSWLAQGLGY
jgi:leader peptidase (prepilin peptidase) / N-methyltransferase